jgi:hypothetical protein
MGHNPAIAASDEHYISEYLYKQGDNPAWQQVNFNDSDWLDIYEGLSDDAGVWWARIHVQVKASANKDIQPGSNSQALLTSILGSYNIYWDGHYLGSNGAYGSNKTNEIPGEISHTISIPPQLWSEGEHVISLQISNFHSPENLRARYFEIEIDENEQILTEAIYKSLIPLMALGGLFIIAIYFLLLYLIYSKEKAYLTFSLLCFLVSALLIAETWKGVVGYTYDWHATRLTLITLFTLLVALLLPLFFLFQFSFKKQWQVMLPLTVILIGIIIVISSVKITNLSLFMTSFIMSLVISVMALRNNKDGALMATLAILIVTVTNLLLPFSFQEQFFFPSFTLLILMVLTSLTQKMAATERDKEKALLNSAHLKITLLKKNIQPHFILNTLTSIEQWIEEEPKTAIKFIDALADEFRVLSSIAEEQLISIQQEIDLCRSHLKIMSYRKDKTFKLTTVDIDPLLMIPPAIIHTLVENALTHNQYMEEKTTLSLTQIPSEKNTLMPITLKLTAPIGINLAASNTNARAGTGLQYIKSRLKESFAEQWFLESEIIENNWVTMISIPRVELKKRELEKSEKSISESDQ